MTRLPVFLFLVTLSGCTDRPTALLPAGWEHFDTQSMHGPEGWFHDRISGAVVHYYTGPMPHLVGATLREGTSCSKGSPLRHVPCLIRQTGRSLHVFIGPDDSIYMSYWSTVDSADQLRRAKELALDNPLAERAYSGHSVLARRAKEVDLRSVTVGMTIYQVLEAMGTPFEPEPSPRGGFSASFDVWGRWPGATAELACYPCYVTLQFSRDRLLVSRSPVRTYGTAGSGPAELPG